MRKTTITTLLKNGRFRVWKGLNFARRAKKCRSCGARQRIQGCPACHRSTWYRDGFYRHDFSGCGFIGLKKNVWVASRRTR